MYTGLTCDTCGGGLVETDDVPGRGSTCVIVKPTSSHHGVSVSNVISIKQQAGAQAVYACARILCSKQSVQINVQN